MDIYHIWCDPKSGVSDLSFVDKVNAYMEHLKQSGKIAGFRITRRKLGLGPNELGEFHIMVEITDLAQLDSAFEHVASRAEPVEGLHHGVNSLATNLTFALYRDFPDAVRKIGEEKF